MEYKTIKKEGYNVYLIPADKFTTNKIELKLIVPAKKENMTIHRVLYSYLYRANKQYPTLRDMFLESERNYILGFSNDYGVESNNFILGSNLKCLEEQYTSTETYEKSFDFLVNSLFNISFEDNDKNKEQLEVVLNRTKKDILKIKDNRKRYSNTRFYEILFPDEPISFHQAGYLEDVDKITLKSLEDYYRYLINEAQVDVFVVGNFNEEIIIKVLDKWFSKRLNNVYSFDVVLNPAREKTLIEKEQIISNQSYLHLGFKIEDMTDYEIFGVLPVLINIYGGNGNSLLFDIVREKHSLCYTIRTNGSRMHKYISVFAGINASNYEKTKMLILQVLDSIKKQDYSDDLISSAKELFANDFKAVEDSKGALIGYVGSLVYTKIMSKEERILLINKVTKEDVAKLADKLILDTIYFLEGVEDGKTGI
jgi:predicted Zn-dependent peptidase